ncbi:transporter substrate-binding domain-containing protein [Roseateles asaccharophilus]|uniref:Arginine/ornithine transport system substrate-binding protein n=1 Tax=Roseateles asaccharophilus TaxID=582607 RepID=A0ABU2A5H3_9BURK|nr:transporter substrate-binding domain-containing protein [Roseateles asaccharophilus]MDR7332409.1 arginine/ornithine transport system substrate-binding protein [Roseateles asaccharophilus]
MRRRTALAAGLALPGATLAQTPQRLRIGFAVGYAPFSEVGSDGQLKGFEVDLAQALCTRMVQQCVPVILDFDGLAPALLSRKIDAIMASMSITPERQQLMAFSTPYYFSPVRLVMRTDARLEASPAGLKGKRIGVERGTIHERFLAAQFKDSQVLRYPTQDQAFLDLKAGRLDATLVDAVIAQFGFLNRAEGRGFAFVGPDFGRQEQFYGKGIGVGMRKGDVATLGRRVDEALAALRGNGTLKALNDRYFSFDLVTPPR